MNINIQFPDLVEYNYITKGNIWAVYETYFGEVYVVFIITNLKTRAIISFATKV